jgi:4-diphosphocytidyl-2-C-methyl-D-erythritol kinase
MRMLAPAKVNLHLRVAPPRADGFHPLLSWMATIGLFDTLEFERTRGPGVELVCDGAGVAADASNLVSRAARAMIERMNRRSEGSAGSGDAGEGPLARSPAPPVGGVAIKLTKRIPVGAGLGGGSSDAARTLVSLNRWWNLDWPREDLLSLAASLGSDVAFFLYAPSAACSGRGEIVRPIDPPTPKWLLLLSPPFGCSTPAVYRRFDQLKLGEEPAVAQEPPWAAWAQLDSQRLLPLLINDLEPAAFAVEPELGKHRDRLERELGRIVRMSGSGSSLFTLFDDEAQAREAEARIHRTFPDLRAQAVELCPRVEDVRP